MNELNKNHVDNCRFCWMCRHICPIGNATGLERNTARARALGLSLVNRGAYGIEEVIDNVYECACCGACTKECVTGWDPVMFLKAARLDAALDGKLPEYINVLVDKTLETGNAYGMTAPAKTLNDAFAAHQKKTDTLFFLGVDARYLAPDAAKTAIALMEKIGDFTLLENELPSGQQLEYLISMTNETKEQFTACAEQLKDYQKIVVYDPQDAKVFLHDYKEQGIALPEVVTFTAFLAEKIKTGKKYMADAAYQDPFQLARDLKETEEARHVIGLFADQKEMLMHGKDTMWAGNLLMAQWMPDVMVRVAEDRIQNARGVKATAIVTASVSEYEALKKVAQNDVKILSIEELVLGGLN